ncbi:MAG: hypothetical protein AB7K64_01125 [Variibacter sp.]
MSESNVIRFEAKDIEPNVSGDLALLVMDTAKDGQVTVWMRRPVFAALFERMRLALDDKA